MCQFKYTLTISFPQSYMHWVTYSIYVSLFKHFQLPNFSFLFLPLWWKKVGAVDALCREGGDTPINLNKRLKTPERRK